MGLVNITGVLMVLNLLLNVVMYVWAFNGKAPLPLFDVTGGVTSYYIFLLKLATLVFFYVMLGAFAALIKGSKLQDNFKK